MFGLTLGVLGALLLGTDEGRKITKQVIDSLPDNLKKVTSPQTSITVPDFKPPLDTPETTPHHAFFSPEAPPPAPPRTTEKPEYLYPSQNTQPPTV